MTPAEFEEAGYDWDAIYFINHTEASSGFYVEGDAKRFSICEASGYFLYNKEQILFSKS